ncbi:MAG: efflux RND transporter permease subunit [Pseudonocardia sp.]|nr:efflux RND transporter permease subunit [Pseudonocardia sp.]
MTWLARLSLRNRAVVGLATVLLVVFGVISTTSLRQELFPSLDVPVATVATTYQGASPEAVEEQVTTPVEQAVSRINGVTGTTSTSTNGSSVVVLNLEYGTNLDDVTSQLQRAVQGLALPTGVTPQVVTGGIGSIPVVQLAVSSNLPADRVADILRTDVQPLLAGVDGVSDVTLTGIATSQVTIALDPAAAAARGVSVQAIPALLQANGVRVPAGQLAPDTNPLTVEVGTPITSAAELADLYLTSPGGPVRLGDVATVTEGPAPATGYTRTNGVPSIGIGVTKAEDANTVAVSHDVQDLLPRISDALGGSAQDAQVTVVFDQAPFIEQSVEDLTTEGLLGLAFAIIVILLFLLSVRATLVTAVSIPLSVLIAMIVLDLTGETLNILTLGALTVAIGRVVDDSIVVIENISRHLRPGLPKAAVARTVIKAVREVAGAITASTITTVAVFAPIGLVGGQVGELFRPFAVTVAAALLASLVVSLTVVPVLASAVLRRKQKKGTAGSPAVPGPEVDARPHEEKRTRLQRGYLPVLRSSIAHPVISLVIAVLILAGTLALGTQLTTNFLGDAGGNTVSISQEMPPGTALPQADDAARRVEGVLTADPEIESYQVTVGSTGGRFGPPGQSRSATRFSVTLRDGADATAVQDDLRTRLAALGGEDQVGQLTVSGGQGGFGSSDLSVAVRADDPQVLAQAADQVQQAVAGIPDVTDVRNDLAAAQPTVEVSVDRAKAAAAGLTEAQVGQLVAGALRGSPVGTVTLDGVTQNVVLRTGDAPADVAALRALPLGRGTLADIATVTETSTAPSIGHTDGTRSAQITARPTGDDVGAATATLRTTLDGLTLPAGASAEIGGVSTQQDDAFAQLGIALLVAIAVVYLVMVVTFRSLVQPLILLVSIPFAATGAIVLLLVTGTPLGVPALIGMLMLIGIVVTNAIVLIDLVNQFRRDGRGLREAVLEGSAQRLRPILMTAVATIFALLPMSLGLTGGGVFISQPLAIVVIGGLITSTLLTLVLVPVLYTLVERLRARLEKRDPELPGPGEDADEDLASGEGAAARQEPATVGAAVAAAGWRVPERAGAAAGAAPAGLGNGGAGGHGGVGGNGSGGGGAVPPGELAPARPGLVGSVLGATGRPVAGASVVVFDGDGNQLAATTSGPDGRYRVTVPAAGEHLVVGYGEAGDPVAERVRFGDRPQRHDVRVTGAGPQGGTVDGVVHAGPHPAPGIVTTLLDGQGTVVGTARTGQDGTFRFTGVEPGDYTVTAHADQPGVRSVRVGEHGPVSVELSVGAARAGRR